MLLEELDVFYQRYYLVYSNKEKLKENKNLR